MKKLKTIFLACLVLGLGTVFASCGSAQPAVTPPPPTLTSPSIVASTPLTASPSVLVSPSPSTTVSPTSSPSGSASAAADFLVTQDKAEVSFPDTITFSLSGSLPQSVNAVNLLYGTDKHSLVNETNTAKPDFQPGKTISAKWVWKMKITGGIPPGANLWWRWELTDNNGKTTTTAKKTLVYSDTRYNWKSISTKDMELYWHDQSDDMIRQLTSEITSRLADIKIDVSIPPERLPRVFVYRSSDELKDAVLFTQGWTGALAFPDYNIILTAVSPQILEWAKRALPHEVTHLIVGEATFGPFGDTPTWLDEGLAQQAEGDLEDYLQQALDKAVQQHSLITLRSLSSSFPAESAAAYLAYAESQSFVKYLLDNYSWEKMNQLLKTFKEGSTYDNALKKVYSLDTDGLEALWKTSIGAS